MVDYQSSALYVFNKDENTAIPYQFRLDAMTALNVGETLPFDTIVEATAGKKNFFAVGSEEPVERLSLHLKRIASHVGDGEYEWPHRQWYSSPQLFANDGAQKVAERIIANYLLQHLE